MSAPEADPALPSRRRRRSRAERLRAHRLRRILISLGLAAAATLVVLAAAFWSSRHQAPSGQVIAVVDGGEITLQDLQAEARAKGLPFDDVPLASLLAPVVDRTLLAHKAQALRLDRRPTYPVDRHRFEQLLLAKQLTDQLVGSPVAPSEAQIAAVIASEPFMFARRQRLRLNQLSFEADDALMAQIGEVPTLAALQMRLKQLGVPNRQAVVTADSADLDPKLNAALLSLPAGGVLTARQGSAVVADSVIDAQPIPPSAVDAEADARRLIEQRRGAQTVNATLAKLRRQAKIEYQAGAGSP